MSDHTDLSGLSKLEASYFSNSQEKIKRRFYQIDISGTKYVEIVNNYISMYPNMFRTNISRKYCYINNKMHIVYNEPVHFDDFINKIKGFIETSYNTEDNEFKMVINIKKNKSKDCYLTKIVNHVEYQLKYGDNIQLYYYKILGDSMIKYTYYNESVAKWMQDINILKSEFFLTEKDYLLSVMENKIDNNKIGSFQTTWNNLILTGKPGTGKCFQKNTMIMMFNGLSKKVQDITVGEQLMGDDSKPRNVLSTTHGEEEMFEIKQGSDSYVVNKSHVLSLYCLNWQALENFLQQTIPVEPQQKSSKEIDIVDISVKNFLQLPDEIRHLFLGFRTSVNFSCNVYNNPAFESINPYQFGKAFSRGNDVNQDVVNYFKFSAVDKRYGFLAGLIDSSLNYIKAQDTYTTLGSQAVNEVIEFVARSLGFSVERWGHVLKIKGHLYKIPTKIQHIKQCKPGILNSIDSLQKNIQTNTPSFATVNQQTLILEPIQIKSVGRGEYYGFEVDGNHRFLLNNFIVTHNSSYVYRIAMMLKLNILSVDISMYLNKKKELYSMFHNQEFCLPNCSQQKETAINNSLIVLEEFDHAVDKLCNIEKIFYYKNKLKTHFLKKKMEEFVEKSEIIKQIEEEKVQAMPESSLPVRDNFEDYMQDILLSDGIDIKNNQITRDFKTVVLEQRDQENDINLINKMLDNLIKSDDEDNRSSILRLSDMLELFQGPVPVKDRIIIATTNNFDKIQNILPALFRSGRMTRIDFNYLDWESLQNLFMYFFKERSAREPFTINIPTSQIIELATKNILIKKSLKEFEEELYRLSIAKK